MQDAGNVIANNIALVQLANPPVEHVVLGENPEIPGELADEDEEDNEEDEAVMEDAADGNNGAQGIYKLEVNL